MTSTVPNRVTIVYPHDNVASETFIRAHVAGLPGIADVLTGGYFPTRDAQGRPLFKSTLSRRVRRVWLRLARGLGGHEITENELACRFRRTGAKVVLAEYGETGVAIMDACRWSGVPLVVHFHGYDAYIGAGTLAAVGRYPGLFRAAAALVVVSEHMREQLLRLGAPEQKLHLNHYGVDGNLFSSAAPESATPSFIAVGRFVEKKAPLLTLAAFRETLRGCPEAKLLMVGDGPLLAVARQWVRGLGMERAVTFAGALDHVSVARHMRQARAFVQHSVCASNGDHEGLPVAVLEASACGLPVVATRHGGIPDAVIDGVTGLLCDEYDVQGMAINMLRLARDREFAAGLGSAGHKRIASEFSMKKSIDGLWRILCEVTGACTGPLTRRSANRGAV